MITGTEAEYQSGAGSTKDTPYLALTGELWGVFCGYLWENWPRYNDIALYKDIMPHYEEMISRHNELLQTLDISLYNIVN